MFASSCSKFDRASRGVGSVALVVASALGVSMLSGCSNAPERYRGVMNNGPNSTCASDGYGLMMYHQQVRTQAGKPDEMAVVNTDD